MNRLNLSLLMDPFLLDDDDEDDDDDLDDDEDDDDEDEEDDEDVETWQVVARSPHSP